MPATDFKPEEFLAEQLTRTSVSRLKKDELGMLVEHLELSEVISVQELLKPALVTRLCKELLEMGFFGEEAIKAAENKVAAERAAEKEHILRMREIEVRAASVNKPVQFNVAQQVRLVPRFSDREVDQFFLAFEKTAISLSWPRDKWTILLQTALTGKALDAYAALSVHQIVDYELVKSEVLRTYELVPEAYRQKFRKLQKPFHETHVEFAREKKIVFERWLSSQKVGTDFNKLREVILFKNYMSNIKYLLLIIHKPRGH